jgi:integrase
MLLGTEGGLRPTRHPLQMVCHPSPIPPELNSEIINFLLWMQREGYSKSSIKNVRKIVVKLANRLGTLLDGDAVKDFVSRMEARGGTKKLNLLAYRLFAKWKGFSFELPRVSDTEAQLPFIPTEAELDSLIAGSSKKLACLLELLKQTGCRIGEAQRIEWADLDSESCVLNIRAEKGSRNRQCKLSQKLVAMLMRLTKENKLIFGGTRTGTFRNRLDSVRKRQASKLENPRLLKIHLHTFRHWKACHTYWKTKDILFTQSVLGHRSLSSTLKYTRLVNWENEDEFVCKAARNLTEITAIVEAGYDYVTKLEDGTQIFRKRK